MCPLSAISWSSWKEMPPCCRMNLNCLKILILRRKWSCLTSYNQITENPKWKQGQTSRVKTHLACTNVYQGHQQQTQWDFPQEQTQSGPIRELLLGKKKSICNHFRQRKPLQTPMLVLLNIAFHLCIIWEWQFLAPSSLNGFLFKIDSLPLFSGSCVDNNGFVYCSEEDCAGVNMQFGIFSGLSASATKWLTACWQRRVKVRVSRWAFL